MAWTIGTVTLTVVTEEEHTKDANLFAQAIPRTDADKAIILDLFGCTRNITVRGTFTGATAAIKTFISDVEALIVGTQTNKTYHSDIGPGAGDYNVKINSFKWRFEEGAPNHIRWDLNLIQSKSGL